MYILIESLKINFKQRWMPIYHTLYVLVEWVLFVVEDNKHHLFSEQYSLTGEWSASHLSLYKVLLRPTKILRKCVNIHLDKIHLELEVPIWNFRFPCSKNLFTYLGRKPNSYNVGCKKEMIKIHHGLADIHQSLLVCY